MRAARELLAIQSSDWAFQETRELAADYPLRRVGAHAADHDAAMSALSDSAVRAGPPAAQPGARPGPRPAGGA